MKSKKPSAKKEPPPAAKPNAASPRRRQWFFRLFALALPLFLFLALELILRLFGYGYPVGFFLKGEVNGQAARIDNQQFSRRYFPPGLARSPQPALFPAVKAPGTMRIFILGESAAMGDPEPSFGFGRVLETMLRERWPGKKIEVINTAVTAINSTSSGKSPATAPASRAITGLSIWATTKWSAPTARAPFSADRRPASR